MSILIGLSTFALVIISVLMVLLVLAQKSKSDGGVGGALGGGMTEATFGADSGNVLSRMTHYGAIAFFVLSFGLYLAQINRHGAARTKSALPSIEVPAVTIPAAAPAAQLTTFNEVDMTNVMALRNQYKEVFEKRHGVKLGFMSFFTKAVVAALKEIPAVNAEIDGTDIIYKNHYDIGVAVGTEKGLVVPVLRDADHLSLAGIEKGIAALGKAARDGALTLDQLQGGTFTITNGGTYGSLMSTPILNAPQSGILGMHNIVQRPMAVDGQVVIRPMMYLALSYDHRIVDGKEAVTFLVRVKELLEDPARALLDL